MMIKKRKTRPFGIAAFLVLSLAISSACSGNRYDIVRLPDDWAERCSVENPDTTVHWFSVPEDMVHDFIDR